MMSQPPPPQPTPESAEQMSLFGEDAFLPGVPGIGPAATAATPAPRLVHAAPLTASSSIGASALAYQDYLLISNHSRYTVTCFLSDLRLLAERLGRETPLEAITAEQLGDWMTHLRLEGKTRPAPKTLARRITFLKNFFGWLAREQVLPRNPADRLVPIRPSPPLPEILFEDEVARLEVAAAANVRAHLLVLTLLHAGLKKEEVHHLRLSHVDLSDPDHPALEVHFPGEAKRRRERRMELPPEWAEVYARYLHRFQPREYVFECTERNLNYVLKAAVDRAGIQKRVTLQLLRDVYAVRHLRAGGSFEELREKLGLSDEAWRESAEKYRKLAFPA